MASDKINGFHHVAGPMEGGVQRCTRCGEILTDFRNTMTEINQPAPTGWGEGSVIEAHGSYSSLIQDLMDITLPSCQPN